MRAWLNGNVLCGEVARYIRNFFVVSRVRADDLENVDGDNSDDLISDEALEVDASKLQEALDT